MSSRPGRLAASLSNATATSSIPAVSTHSTPVRRTGTPSSRPGGQSHRPPSGSGTDASPSEAPTEPAEVDLETLSHAELAALVEEAELRNRVLIGENERRENTESRLRDAVRETVEKAEVEEDRLSNMLLRRADALRHQHQSLLAHLSAEERQVRELDKKFKRMATENSELEQTLLAEEEHIVERLRQQIAMVDRQKKEIAEKLTLELGDVAAHVERLQLAPPVVPGQAESVASPSSAQETSPKHVDPTADAAPKSDPGVSSPSRTIPLVSPGGPEPAAPPTAARLSQPYPQRGTPSGAATPLGHSITSAMAAAGLAGSVAGYTGSPAPSANSSVVLRTPLGLGALSGGDAGWPRQATGAGTPPAPVGSLPPPQQQQQRQASERSPSASSSVSVSQGRNLAQDYSMVKLLQQEIDRVASLDADLAARNAAYKERIANLESRVDRAKLEWEKQRAQADRLRQELSRTKSLTRELVANHELLVEWQAEREINTSHASRGQSVASTPRQAPAFPSPPSAAGGSLAGLSRSGRGAGVLPPSASSVAAANTGGQSPQATPRGGGIAPPLARSVSVASQGDESTYSGAGIGDTPGASNRSMVDGSAAPEPPTVLHGGTPMSSARRQFVNGSACSDSESASRRQVSPFPT